MSHYKPISDRVRQCAAELSEASAKNAAYIDVNGRQLRDLLRGRWFKDQRVEDLHAIVSGDQQWMIENADAIVAALKPFLRGDTA